MPQGTVTQKLQLKVQDVVNKGQEVAGIAAIMNSKFLLAAGAAGTFAAGMGKAASQAMKLEQQVASVAKVTNEAVGQKVMDNIRELNQEIPISRKKLAETAAAAGRLGVEGSENITRFTETIAKMSTATDISGGKAAESMARILKLTQTNAKNVGKMSDAFVMLGNNVAASESEILRSVTKSAGALNTLGMKKEQILALNASLVEVSSSASRAGTRIRSAITALRDPSQIEAAAEALNMSANELKNMRDNSPIDFLILLSEELSKSGKTAEKLSGKLNNRVLNVLNKLSIISDDLKERIKKTNNQLENGGATIDEFNRFASTSINRLKLMSQNFNEVATSIGNNFVGSIGIASDSMTELMKKTNKWLKSDFVKKHTKGDSPLSEKEARGFGQKLERGNTRSGLYEGAADVLDTTSWATGASSLIGMFTGIGTPAGILGLGAADMQRRMSNQLDEWADKFSGNFNDKLTKSLKTGLQELDTQKAKDQLRKEYKKIVQQHIPEGEELSDYSQQKQENIVESIIFNAKDALENAGELNKEILKEEPIKKSIAIGDSFKQIIEEDIGKRRAKELARQVGTNFNDITSKIKKIIKAKGKVSNKEIRKIIKNSFPGAKDIQKQLFNTFALKKGGFKREGDLGQIGSIFGTAASRIREIARSGQEKISSALEDIDPIEFDLENFAEAPDRNKAMEIQNKFKSVSSGVKQTMRSTLGTIPEEYKKLINKARSLPTQALPTIMDKLNELWQKMQKMGPEQLKKNKKAIMKTLERITSGIGQKAGALNAAAQKAADSLSPLEKMGKKLSAKELNLQIQGKMKELRNMRMKAGETRREFSLRRNKIRQESNKLRQKRKGARDKISQNTRQANESMKNNRKTNKKTVDQLTNVFVKGLEKIRKKRKKRRNQELKEIRSKTDKSISELQKKRDNLKNKLGLLKNSYDKGQSKTNNKLDKIKNSNKNQEKILKNSIPKPKSSTAGQTTATNPGKPRGPKGQTETVKEITKNSNNKAIVKPNIEVNTNAKETVRAEVNDAIPRIADIVLQEVKEADNRTKGQS